MHAIRLLRSAWAMGNIFGGQNGPSSIVSKAAAKEVAHAILLNHLPPLSVVRAAPGPDSYRKD